MRVQLLPLYRDPMAKLFSAKLWPPDQQHQHSQELISNADSQALPEALRLQILGDQKHTFKLKKERQKNYK